MRSPHIPKSLAWMAAILVAAQLACGSGPVVATTLSPSPTAVQAVPSPQAAQAVPSPVRTSTGTDAASSAAQVMLNAVVQHYQAVGRDQALKDFTAKKPPFDNSSLYIVCLGADHKMTANSEYPMLVGLSADAINGPRGKPLGQEVWDTASAIPQGTVPIEFDNPLTGKSESKVLYYQKLDQDVCAVASDNTK